MKMWRLLTSNHHEQKRLELDKIILLPIKVDLSSEKQRETLKQPFHPLFPVQFHSSIPHSWSKPWQSGWGMLHSVHRGFSLLLLPSHTFTLLQQRLFVDCSSSRNIQLLWDEVHVAIFGFSSR